MIRKCVLSCLQCVHDTNFFLARAQKCLVKHTQPTKSRRQRNSTPLLEGNAVFYALLSSKDTNYLL